MCWLPKYAFIQIPLRRLHARNGQYGIRWLWVTYGMYIPANVISYGKAENPTPKPKVFIYLFTTSRQSSKSVPEREADASLNDVSYPNKFETNPECHNL
jgi:hypothetical protein